MCLRLSKDSRPPELCLARSQKRRAAATQNAARRFSAHLITLLTIFTPAPANSAAEDAKETDTELRTNSKLFCFFKK